jgi:hypothetical protein
MTWVSRISLSFEVSHAIIYFGQKGCNNDDGDRSSSRLNCALENAARSCAFEQGDDESI